MSTIKSDWTRRDFVAATATAAAGAGLLSALGSRAQEPAPISLPTPKLDGKFSIEAALQKRRSIRTYASSPLTLGDIGQLCWAAQGQNDPEGFRRTAPSAHGVYPLELYVAAGMVTGLQNGFYRYSPDAHSLALVASGDKRPVLDRMVMQTWNHIATAPAVFVLSGNPSKMTGSEDLLVRRRAVEFMWAEAGCAAQGFFLQAGARGLGSTFVGGFDPKAALEILGLPPAEEVLALLPVGKRM
jgi:SagB-type dehydrogenase family enzyme